MSRPESRRDSLNSSAAPPSVASRDASLQDVRTQALLAMESLDHGTEMDAGNPPDWDESDGDILGAWKCVWPASVGVMLVFWATLAVFPGVVTRIPSAGYDPRNWMPVILIATFNVGDLTGRYTAGLVESMVSESVLVVMIIARIAIVPVLIYLQLFPTVLKGFHDAAAISAVLLLATSNGLCASLTLIKGQRRVMPGQQNETASTILALAMCLGLVLGAITALPISTLTARYTPSPPP